MTNIVLGEDDMGGLLELESSQQLSAVHVLGIQGVGKSVCLGSLALQFSDADNGVILFDIKDAKLARDVAGRADPDKLLFFQPGLLYKQHRKTIGLNPLEGERELATETIVDLYSMLGETDASMTRVDKFIRLGVSLAAAQPHQTTLLDVRNVISEPAIRQKFLANAQGLTQNTRDGWRDFEKFNAYQKTQTTESTLSRIDKLLGAETLAAMLSQPTSTLHLAEALDAGKILVFDLVTGMPHGHQSIYLANVIMAMLVNAAMIREVDSTSRVWRVVADEADLLAPDAFVTSTDKLRASRVFAIFANQNMTQLANKSLSASLLSSPVKIYCRISPDDVRKLTDTLGSHAQAQALSKLPKHHAMVQVMDDEEPSAMWGHLTPEKDEWRRIKLADWIRPFNKDQFRHAQKTQLDSPHVVQLDRIETHATHPLKPASQVRPSPHNTPAVDRAVRSDTPPHRPSPLRLQRPD